MVSTGDAVGGNAVETDTNSSSSGDPRISAVKSLIEVKGSMNGGSE